jgi:hypothetical protein
VEVMWLLVKLTSDFKTSRLQDFKTSRLQDFKTSRLQDFKTIADFRACNAQALTAVCKQFVALCRHWDLFGGELVAVDGSKFCASNSRHRIFTATRLTQQLERIEQKIREYLAELDENDRHEESAPSSPCLSAPELRERLSKLKERQQRYQGLQRMLSLLRSAQRRRAPEA